MKHSVEPGLLPVFRLFAVFQLVFLGFSILSFSTFEEPKHPLNVMWGMALTTALLVIYLSIPSLERGLGKLYLPLAILVAVSIPIAGETIILLQGSGSELGSIREETVALLLLPLLVVSWQYPFPVVAVFVVATGFLDFSLVRAILGHNLGRGFDSYHRLIVGLTIAFLAAGYIITWLMSAQRAQRRSLARANAALAHYAATLEQLTVSRERNRMARELHDTLAHTLSGIAVQLEAVRSLWDSEPAEARALLDQSLGFARRGLAETRNALRSLRATPLEDMGLVLATRDLAEGTCERAGLELEFACPELPELSADVEHGIYRVAQEALENVVRHAGAKKISLSFGYQGGQISLEISDDGRGFDPSAVAQGQFGLRGMQERAAMMNAAFHVQSEKGKGTRITLMVPVQMEKERG